jgi:hypothetical protein
VRESCVSRIQSFEGHRLEARRTVLIVQLTLSVVLKEKMNSSQIIESATGSHGIVNYDSRGRPTV